MKKIRKVEDLHLQGKRVFLRLDLNVPLVAAAGGGYAVGDRNRILGALPTIQYVMERGGKCILASHLGRPDGKKNPKYSLEPVGAVLSELLGKDVILTDDCIGDGARGLSMQMRSGDVMLLENLRFHGGEEENSPDFVARLAELCDVYVSDAFGTLHRAHASTCGLAKVMNDRGAGLLVQKELSYLAPLREEPQRPFALVMGGSKVSDKIGILEHFMSKLDTLIIGGAMAYAFLRAKGYTVGNSYCDDKQVTLAARLLKSAAARNIQVCLPLDHRVAKSLTDTASSKITEGPDIHEGWMGVDIGPKSLEAYSQAVQNAETIFWNGPMGVFETPEFAVGTFGLAKAIAECKGKKLAGGGDVAAALAESGCADRFDFISTGGGATLEYLEGKDLPGLKVLEVSDRPS